MAKKAQEEPKQSHTSANNNDQEEINSFIRKIHLQNKLMQQIIEKLELKQRIKK